MRGKIMKYIYDYISEERKKEIADMNIVDTYNRTGYLDIPGDKVVKSKDEYFLFWYKQQLTVKFVNRELRGNFLLDNSGS